MLNSNFSLKIPKQISYFTFSNQYDFISTLPLEILNISQSFSFSQFLRKLVKNLKFRNMLYLGSNQKSENNTRILHFSKIF